MNDEPTRSEVLADIFQELALRAPAVDWESLRGALGSTAAVDLTDPTNDIDGFLTVRDTLVAFLALVVSLEWCPSANQIARFLSSLDDTALVALADHSAVEITADVVWRDVPVARRASLINGLVGAAESILNFAIDLPKAAGLRFHVNEIDELEFRWEGEDS